MHNILPLGWFPKHQIWPTHYCKIEIIFTEMKFKMHFLYILAMQNYRMLTVGITSLDYLITLVGENVICDQTSMPKFAVNDLPSKIQRVYVETIAYSFETSLLLMCGGIYVITFQQTFNINRNQFILSSCMSLNKCVLHRHKKIIQIGHLQINLTANNNLLPGTQKIRMRNLDWTSTGSNYSK